MVLFVFVLFSAAFPQMVLCSRNGCGSMRYAAVRRGEQFAESVRFRCSVLFFLPVCVDVRAVFARVPGCAGLFLLWPAVFCGSPLTSGLRGSVRS